MKIKILIMTLSLMCANFLAGKLANGDWEAIAISIASIGDHDDKGKFEAAKQAFLNIALTRNRKRAATAIAKKWATEYPHEATEGALLELIAYPKMSDKDIKKAAVDLFDKKNIKDFLTNEQITVDTTTAKASLAT